MTHTGFLTKVKQKGSIRLNGGGPDASYLKGQGDFSLAKGISMRNLLISIGTFERPPRPRQQRQLPPLNIRPE